MAFTVTNTARTKTEERRKVGIIIVKLKMVSSSLKLSRVDYVSVYVLLAMKKAFEFSRVVLNGWRGGSSFFLCLFWSSHA